MRPVVIVSADKEIIELARENSDFDVIGILDPRSDAQGLGLPILGADKAWGELVLKYPNLKAVLALDPPKIKEKLAVDYGIDSLATLISQDAYISPTALLSKGCLVQRGAKIMSEVRIGLACKVNVNATLHHDTVVADFCTLAPASQLLGAVKIEERVFVGAGAIVLPKVHIGKDSVIGAGAVVVKDVPAHSTVAGVPARPLAKRIDEGKR